MGVQVVRSETSSRPLHLENVVFNDVVLLDFGAVFPSALDFKKLARDCELLKEAFLNAPDEVLKIIAALQSGPSLTGVTQALKIAQDLGLTEEMAIQKGGGILAAVLAIGAILLLEGCGHYIQGGQVLGPTAPTSQPPDAGPGPSDAGADPG
jgi:hypothetical protein